MKSLENIRTIFFDYDGTLHDSIKIYAPAFQKAYDYLVKEGFAENKKWSDKEISYWLGFNPQEMWSTFMPNLSDKIRHQCSNMIGEEMSLQIEKGKPVLYEGALEMLQYLKSKGYHLVFISNCKTYYKECHCNLFQLDRYFESLVCSEEYNFISKDEILSMIKPKYPEEMVIVGDRKQDIEAGKNNNIYTIGCTYGYALNGELEDANLLIHSIKDLSKYL